MRDSEDHLEVTPQVTKKIKVKGKKKEVVKQEGYINKKLRLNLKEVDIKVRCTI